MSDRIIFAFDRQTARSFDADGRMRVKNCILSTAEVNPYRGAEIPDPDGTRNFDSNRVYELFRDPEELRKAVPTFEGLPLMIKHIPQTAEDPRKEYIGGSVHSITFDGKYLRGDLLVMDGAAIDLIESGELADLSCGYRYTPVMHPGEAGGAKYDGRMTDIQGNHVALVDDGRASKAHVADSAFRNPQQPNPSMQGDSKMPFPEKKEGADTAGADDGQETAAPPKGETPAGETAAPAEGATPAAPDAGAPDANGDMAAVGQALKHIAAMLEQLCQANGAQAPGAMDRDPDGDEITQRAEDEQGAGEGVEAERQAADMELEAAVGEGSAMDSDEGIMGAIAKGKQDGTGARGNTTPLGAMDAKMKAAVQSGIKQERARAAAVATAQRDVRGVLGDVYGLDSASDIYREALKQVGADVSKIAKGAERAAWQGYAIGAGTAAGARPTADMALDSKAVTDTQARLSGFLNKISVKG